MTDWGEQWNFLIKSLALALYWRRYIFLETFAKTDVKARDDSSAARHLGLRWDQMRQRDILECWRLTYCQHTDIKMYYSHAVSHWVSITLAQHQLMQQMINKSCTVTNSCSMRANKQFTLTEHTCNGSWWCMWTVSVHSHETKPWWDTQVEDRAKIRHTRFETETRPRHEKPCLKMSWDRTRVSRLHHCCCSLRLWIVHHNRIGLRSCKRATLVVSAVATFRVG